LPALKCHDPHNPNTTPTTRWMNRCLEREGQLLLALTETARLQAALDQVKEENAKLREQLTACTTLASHSAPAWLRAREEKVELRVKQAAKEIVSTESACIEWGASPEQSVDTVAATIRSLLKHLAADAQLEERKKKP
jgi:hypothetical protein